MTAATEQEFDGECKGIDGVKEMVLGRGKGGVEVDSGHEEEEAAAAAARK